MRIGLSFEEFAELRMRPRAGADPVFHEAAEMTLAELFPMNTISASDHLRRCGYDSRPEMLELLIENGVVKLSEYELGTSRISKLWLRRQADRQVVANFDRGWDVEPTTGTAREIVDFPAAGIAEHVFGH